MLLALLMYRTIFARGTVRTIILIPYGIVTVAAATAGSTPGRRTSATWSRAESAPLTSQGSAIAIIILAEIWKTTPFMALLLMAGLSLVPRTC
jgi:multiple sugar transport system permease protein